MVVVEVLLLLVVNLLDVVRRLEVVRRLDVVLRLEVVAIAFALVTTSFLEVALITMVVFMA